MSGALARRLLPLGPMTASAATPGLCRGTPVLPFLRTLSRHCRRPTNRPDSLLSAPPLFRPYSSLPRPPPKRTGASPPTEHTAELAPDAPSRLTSASARLPPSLKRTGLAFLALSKPRLSFLIVLTTTTAYALYPDSAATLATGSVTPPSLLESALSSSLPLACLTVGTAACAASANALNMLYEPRSDALMQRTRNRPLVRGLLSGWQAAAFAAAAAIAGVSLLDWGTNPVVAGLGLANIVLYAGVYTPLKHMSVINTWAGAVVGAIPPLMGWAAAAGRANRQYQLDAAVEQAHLSRSQQAADLWGFLSGFGTLLLDYPADSAAPDTALFGGWLLATVLFSWQFPHFNALAHPLRDQYRRAGLRMLAWAYPRKNAAVALRHSAVLAAVAVLALPASGTVGPAFVVAAAPASAWLAAGAWRYRAAMAREGVAAAATTRAARQMFWASVWYLPIVLISAMLTKPGLWDGLVDRVRGVEEGEGEGERERER